MKILNQKWLGHFELKRRLLLTLLLLSVFVGGSVYAQNNDTLISGSVKNESGEAVVGATITAGQNYGALTDANGEFSLAVPATTTALRVSHLAYLTQDITLGNRTRFEIVMMDDQHLLDEFVVVGFGVQKKVNLTGSVGTVDAKNFENRPVATATQALQGIVPGLNITSADGGSMGADNKTTINIRGIGTIGAGSTGAPLILIDGMEGDINIVNPLDIENISVLKDAASSSIYGSRAPFGVIMITTKKGKKGKPTVNYTNNLRWSDPILMPRTMDSYTFALTMNEGHINGGYTPFFDADHLKRIQDYQAGTLKESVPVNPDNPTYWMDGYYGGNDNVDYFDAIYRNWVFSQDHNLSVSGASDKIGYYASFNYLDQNGLMEFNQDTYDKFATTLKLNAKLTDWADLNVNTRYSKEDYRRPTNMSDGLHTSVMRTGWPTLPLYDPNGYLFSAPSPALGLQEGGRAKWETENIYQQFQLVIEPVRGWKIFGEYNFRSTNRLTSWDQQQLINHDANGEPYVYDGRSSVHNDMLKESFSNVNVYSDYTYVFDSGHTLKAMAGFQSELYKTKVFGAERVGLIVPSFTEIDLTSGIDYWGGVQPPKVNGSGDHWSTAGFFGRINYDYKQRYLLEANVRHDGTSRYRAGLRWNTFMSASAGWNVSEELFWEPLKRHVDQLKLRASYGELGNQNTDNYYPTYQQMGIGSANGLWLIGGGQPNTATAPKLVSTLMSWERINTWNFGIDFSALRGRLTGSYDYFVRKTLDMIGPAPELPLTLGTEVPKTNNTDLKTYGWELSLTWNDRTKFGLGYSIRLLLSDSQTTITRYPNETNSLNESMYRKNQKMGEIWGYTTLGIARTQDQMDSHLASLTNGGQDALGDRWEMGDIMFVDKNKDGKIDAGAYTLDDHGDLSIIGNSTPRYMIGLDLSADYKAFDIRLFFQGVLKRDFFQNDYVFWGVTNNVWSVAPTTNHTDYFRGNAEHPLGQNLDSYFPRPDFSSAKNQQVQTKYMQNAAYLRLKNIQLGYTLPASFTQKFAVSKLRIYVSCENLLTFTSMFKQFDPETISGGWGGAVYPLSKSISFGVNVNF